MSRIFFKPTIFLPIGMWSNIPNRFDVVYALWTIEVSFTHKSPFWISSSLKSTSRLLAKNHRCHPFGFIRPNISFNRIFSFYLFEKSTNSEEISRLTFGVLVWILLYYHLIFIHGLSYCIINLLGRETSMEPVCYSPVWILRNIVRHCTT